MKHEGGLNTRGIYISERISKELRNILDYSLTIVEAPMGYGKTTAVREFLSRTGATILWQHVYNESEVTFWNAFCRLFRDSGLSGRMISLGPPSDSVSIQTALDMLEDLGFPEKTVLVIDDFHIIDCISICNFFEQLVRREIPNLHIVLTARFYEFAGFEELKLKGYACHVTKECLEFHSNEIIEYFKVCGLQISKTDADSLYASTEGWISALYLLMLDYVAEGTYQNGINIYILLEKTIYAALPDEVKDFYVRMCVFDSFTAEQAVYIWGGDNARKFIEEAAKKNAFIEYDARKKTFHIHSIFINLLKEKFEARDKQYRHDVYKRAAEWFAGGKAFLRAADYFFMAEMFDELLDTLEADNLKSVTGEKRSLIIKYYTQCPENIRSRHPVVLILFGMVFFSFNETALFSQVCAEFMGGIHANGYAENVRNRLMGEFEMLLSFTKYNDIASMSEHHRRAYTLLGGTSRIYTPSGSWTFGSPSVLYLFYRESGKLEEHVTEMNRAMSVYYALTENYGNGAELVMESERFFNALDFVNAEITVTKAMHKAQSNNQTGIILCALFLKIRMAFVKGDFAGVTGLFREMQEVIYNRLEYLFIHTVRICEGFIFSLLNQTDKVPLWIEEGDFRSGILPFPVIPMLNIVYGRTLLIKGEYAKLTGSAPHFLGLASVFPNLLGQIYTHIYTAASSRKLFRQQEALEALGQALDIAMPDRVYMPFIENADHILPLLEELQSKGLWRDEISRIVEFSREYSTSMERITNEYFSGKKAALTAREHEIAILAGEGLSNREIGKRLYISENTVKTALKSIFAKLEIDSRSLITHVLA